MEHKIRDLLSNNKALFLSLDQTLENQNPNFHPKLLDFNYIFNIAKDVKFNAVIMQKGMAAKYHENYKYKIPLILRLNGKAVNQLAPYSPQICTVSKAAKLGAHAVGYTMYFGSPHEPTMLKEFARIEEEAHDQGLPVILWANPKTEDTNTLASVARSSLELGADFIKLKYNEDHEGFHRVVKSAGNSKVFINSLEKINPKNMLLEAYETMNSGANGLVIGRNFLQYNKPLNLAAALKSIILGKRKLDYALKVLGQ